MATRPAKPAKRIERRGGRREGAGRKPVYFLPSGARMHRRVRKRPEVSTRTPVHIILRASPDVGSLRRRRPYEAIRAAIEGAAERGFIRIVHASVQRDHVHLLVEAPDARALASGMQGLQVSAARRVNAALAIDQGLDEPRRGRVFITHYQAEILRTPEQARRALAAVLNNWRVHGEATARSAAIDPYASGHGFDGWQGGAPAVAPPAGHKPLPVLPPRSRLLTTGWRTLGAIDPRELPPPSPELHDP